MSEPTGTRSDYRKADRSDTELRQPGFHYYVPNYGCGSAKTGGNV